MPISLRSKLALAFTVASLCLLGMVYALTQRGFDRDFSEFVGKQQLRNASEVEQRLVDLYQQENAWPPAHGEILRRAIAGDVMGREHERRRALISQRHTAGKKPSRLQQVSTLTCFCWMSCCRMAMVLVCANNCGCLAQRPFYF